MPKLRQPKEITYPENPWQGIARVTVRRRDYRFDGPHGSPESREQHAEWVRIYDETGTPPEIATVRASLLVQREGIPMPVEYNDLAPVSQPSGDVRFAVGMATAIGCTLVLSGSLLFRPGFSPAVNSPSPERDTTFVRSEPDLDQGRKAVESAEMERPFPRLPGHRDRQAPVPSREVSVDRDSASSSAPTRAEMATRLENLTPEQTAEYLQIVRQQGHLAGMKWLGDLQQP